MNDPPQDLDCRVASRLISDALDDAVSAADQERMRRHFVVCETCRDVSKQMSFLRRAMRRLGSGSATVIDDV